MRCLLGSESLGAPRPLALFLGVFTGFSVKGEGETRVSTYLGDGGEVEGPKIAISMSRVSKFETKIAKNCHKLPKIAISRPVFRGFSLVFTGFSVEGQTETRVCTGCSVERDRDEGCT